MPSHSARFDPRDDLSETQRPARLDGEHRHFTFLGYREYRLAGGKGTRDAWIRWRIDRSRHTASGPRACRQAPAAFLSERHPPPESGARLARPGHQGEFPVDRASRGFSRLHRRETFRTQGPIDRRAALPGTCGLRPPTTPTRATSRWCATRYRAAHPAFRARSRQSRRQGAAAHPRVFSRAMNCSRPASAS